MGFPYSSVGRESACNAGDPALIPGSERFPREGNGNPLQYSCLETSMDREECWATVHGVTKSWTPLSELDTFTHLPSLIIYLWFTMLSLFISRFVKEKEMATHSSIFAWRVPWTEEPGGQPSMGSHRVGQDSSDLAAAGALFIRKKSLLDYLIVLFEKNL